ncbi:MAG: hypothetical protein BWY74_01042 [Firmicutes bacterium ADurb.Bin419]|nr:MAG: hypothetical protein BWY74_01042 [Firmicutes bacterium ADurb.Bin419]
MARKDGLQEAAEGYRIRARRPQSWVARKMDDRGYSHLKRFKKSFIDTMGDGGKITLSHEREHYRQTRKGLYGQDNSLVKDIQDDNIINLQEIIDPGLPGKGLLESSYISFSRSYSPNSLSVSVSSRAQMQPYDTNLPRKSRVYYLTNGWQSEDDERSMVGRDFIGYYARNVDREKYINKFFSRFAITGLLYLEGSSVEFDEDTERYDASSYRLITMFKGE